MTTYKRIIRKYLRIKGENISIGKKIHSIRRNSKRYTILSKRILLNRRGYTVHSPFIYSFIHRVIKNKTEYYCYKELKEKTKDIRKKISSNKNSNSIYRVSLLELVFRISNNTNIDTYIIVSDNVSAIPDYLENRNKNIMYITSQEYSSKVLAKDFIVIFEDICLDTINKIYDDIQHKTESIFIISTRNKDIKDRTYNIAENNKEKFASIELNNLDIWFANSSITPSRAKVYYK